MFLQSLNCKEVCLVLGKNQGNDGQVTIGLGLGAQSSSCLPPRMEEAWNLNNPRAMSNVHQGSSAQPVDGAVALHELCGWHTVTATRQLSCMLTAGGPCRESRAAGFPSFSKGMGRSSMTPRTLQAPTAFGTAVISPPWPSHHLAIAQALPREAGSLPALSLACRLTVFLVR